MNNGSQQQQDVLSYAPPELVDNHGLVFMQNAITRYPSLLQQGFTLIEIMVVVVILGILAALIAPNVIGRIDEARVTAARNDIRTIESALQLYRMDNFRYPSTEEGIDALVNKPDDPDIKWPEGGYLQRLPQDPWNRPYLYLQPGNNGEYDLYTFGRDGQQGGEGPDGDIGNWSLN